MDVTTTSGAEVVSDQDVAAMFIVSDAQTASRAEDNSQTTAAAEQESKPENNFATGSAQHDNTLTTLQTRERPAQVVKETNVPGNDLHMEWSDAKNSHFQEDSCANHRTEDDQGVSPNGPNTLQCPTCKNNFPLNLDLSLHRCVAVKEPPTQDILSCTVCKTAFDNMDKLKDHMKQHWDDLPYKCHVCAERYWTEASLRRHLLKHEPRDKPFACSLCNSKYVHKRQLTLHVANVHSKETTVARKFPCGMCDRNFLRKCDLSKHLKKCVSSEVDSNVTKLPPLQPKHDDTFTAENSMKSETPDKLTSRPETDLEHSPESDIQTRASESEEYGQKSTENGKSKQGALDNDQFSALLANANLLSILSSIQGSGVPAALAPFLNLAKNGLNFFVPPQSQTSGSYDQEATKDHDIDEERESQSSDDNAKSESRRKSKHPRRTVATLLDNIPTTPELGEKLADVVETVWREQQRALLARLGAAGGATALLASSPDGALYNCQHCTKPFRTLTELQEHCSTHGSNVFVCKYCKKVLSSQVSLYRHEADHEDNRPFKCELCAKAFVLRAELNRHTEVQHSRRPFTCPVCRFNFSCQANLDAHMPVHTEKKVCSLCPRSFTTETYLQRHMAKHHTA